MTHSIQWSTVWATFAPALRAALGGSLCGVLTLFRAVSFATVLAHASHGLEASFGLFLQSLLLSTALSQAMYSLRHRIPWVASCPSSTAIPFYVQLLRSETAGASPQAAGLRALVAIALSFVAVSAFFCILSIGVGRKLDVMKGSFPQPLIYGLFGSIGVAMVQSGVELVAGPQGLWAMASAPQTACALFSGTLMRFVSRTRFGRSALVLPALLLAQAFAFWTVVLLAGSTGDEIVQRDGWLFEQFEAYSLVDYLNFWARVFMPSSWMGERADLHGLLQSGHLWTQIVALLPVLVLDIILSVLPLEQLTGCTLPSHRELGLAASTCLVAAAGGGGASYLSLSPSRLCLEAGGSDSWVTGMIAVLVPAAGLTPLGPKIVAVCPKFLVAGLLTYLGLGYALEGLWDPRKLIATLAPAEYGVVLVILVMSFLGGLPEAIILGLLLLSFLFVLRYGQGEVVQLACSASDLPSLRSRRYRTPLDWACLRPLRSRVFVIRTYASHLFFGSISMVMSTAAPWYENVEAGRRFLLLDLGSVQSVDSSAISAIRGNAGQDVTVLLAGLRGELVERLRNASALTGLRCFDSLDDALEYCEDELMREAGFGLAGKASPAAYATVTFQPARGDQLSAGMTRTLRETKVPAPLSDTQTLLLLGRCFPGISAELLSTLLDARHCDRLSFVQGAAVADEGDACRAMLVCLSGTLAFYAGGPVRLPQVIHETLGVDPSAKRIVCAAWPGDETAKRGGCLRELGPGDAFGELALLTPTPPQYLGSLVARTGCEILAIGRQVLLSLETAADLKPILALHRALAVRLMQQDSDGKPLPLMVGKHREIELRRCTSEGPSSA